MNAATAAATANEFGSATSSVLIARTMRARSFLSGTTIAAVPSPAMLNAFVGAMQVTLISRHSSDTEANGT